MVSPIDEVSRMTREKTNRRPRKPTPAEVKEQMAVDGDVDGLWRILTETHWDLLDQGHCFRLLLRALENAVQRDPLRFTEALFGRMLSFTTFLVLRVHFRGLSLFRQFD